MSPVAIAKVGASSVPSVTPCNNAPASRFNQPASELYRLASKRYLRTKAVPNKTVRLRKSLRASNEENWLFQSVQRKKNENSQWNKPRSGKTELKACAEAKKMVTNIQMCATFVSGGKSLRTHS